MDSRSDTKLCPMCCLEIPQQAKKCPHCEHFQKHTWLTGMNPVMPMVIIMIPITVMVFFLFARIFDRGEDFRKYGGQLVAERTEIVFGESKSGPTVAVMGTLNNTSDVPWERIALHVEFMDATGKRVDVGARQVYDLRVSAHGEATFKVSFLREFPAAGYAKAVVSVVGARDARGRF